MRHLLVVAARGGSLSVLSNNELAPLHLVCWAGQAGLAAALLEAGAGVDTAGWGEVLILFCNAVLCSTVLLWPGDPADAERAAWPAGSGLPPAPGRGRPRPVGPCEVHTAALGRLALPGKPQLPACQ